MKTKIRIDDKVANESIIRVVKIGRAHSVIQTTVLALRIIQRGGILAPELPLIPSPHRDGLTIQNKDVWQTGAFLGREPTRK